MGVLRYSTIKCDICLDCDPALSFPSAKEARKYFQDNYGYIRERGKDFCSEKCLDEYLKSKGFDIGKINKKAKSLKGKLTNT